MPGHTNRDDQPDAAPSRRRYLLAAAGLATTAGCVQRTNSILNRSPGELVSVTIKTVPADDDPAPIRIARFLSKQLHEVGVQAQVVPMERRNLLLDVLSEENFDLYVAQSPEEHDPDFLRPMLHSSFYGGSGWQNPFGYADLTVDDGLVRQRRRSGAARTATLRELQHAVALDQPFTVVAYPDEIRVARSDGPTGWPADGVHDSLGYLRLSPGDPRDGTRGDGTEDDSTPTGDGERRLRMTTTDARATENLNPIAVEFRDDGTVPGLVYDHLGRHVDGAVRPWLASSWEWTAWTDGRKRARLTLREGLAWHDGEPIDAADVAFTYRFLADTSMGGRDTPVPAPRFRGATSLVEDVSVVDDRTVRLSFAPASREVAVRAFDVPVLPAHVWRTKTGQASIAGVGSGGEVTEALVWRNPRPIGSGPLRFESAEKRTQLTLRPYRDHFLAREPDGLDDHLAPYAGGFAFDELRFLVVPSGSAALGLIRDGDADATASNVAPANVPRAARSDRFRLFTEQPNSFYHVGFNARRAPTGNPRFRRAVARLLDKAYLAETVFDGFARPAASPLVPYDAMAPDLRWTGSDPELPFPGTNGQLDVERARESFRNAGYRYDDRGRLHRD